MHNKKRLMRVLGGGAIYAATFFLEFDNDILNIATAVQDSSNLKMPSCNSKAL